MCESTHHPAFAKLVAHDPKRKLLLILSTIEALQGLALQAVREATKFISQSAATTSLNAIILGLYATLHFRQFDAFDRFKQPFYFLL